MAPFVQILVRAEMIAAFGDDDTAVMAYDTETLPVASAPAAECGPPACSMSVGHGPGGERGRTQQTCTGEIARP